MGCLGQVQSRSKKLLTEAHQGDPNAPLQPADSSASTKSEQQTYKAVIKAPISSRVYSMLKANDATHEPRIQTESSVPRLHKKGHLAFATVDPNNQNMRVAADNQISSLSDLLSLRSISSLLKNSGNSMQITGSSPDLKINTGSTKTGAQGLAPRITHAASVKNLAIGSSSMPSNNNITVVTGNMQSRSKISVKTAASQKYGNPYDIIEDLEVNVLMGHLDSPIQLYSAKKLISVVEIDLEKKKDLVCTVYKTLVSRNSDVDKKIHSFKVNAEAKRKIAYDPSSLSKRGEAYLENFKSQDLMKNISKAKAAESLKMKDLQQNKLRLSYSSSKPSLDLPSATEVSDPVQPHSETKKNRPARSSINMEEDKYLKKERPSSLLHAPISFYNFSTETLFFEAPANRKGQKPLAKDAIITTKKEKSLDRHTQSTQNLRPSFPFESFKTPQVASMIKAVLDPSSEPATFLKKKRRLINASINSEVPVLRPTTSHEKIHTQKPLNTHDWEHLEEIDQTNIFLSSKSYVRRARATSAKPTKLQIGGFRQEAI